MADKTKDVKYLPPEGGWGYIIALSVSIIFIVTIVPTTVFGMVYGEFLANLGDETGGTTLVNGVFNTVLCFTGLPANHMLQNYSYRMVGLIGAVLFFVGAFLTIFVTSLFQMLISFGVLQGIGFGFLMPAAFTAFNAYFEKNQNVFMGLCQALIVLASICWPAITKWLLDEFGFRGTVAVFAALSLNAFPAMIAMQPVKYHSANVEVTAKEEVLEKRAEVAAESILGDRAKSKSVPSLSGYASSLQNINQHDENNKMNKMNLWESVSKSLDLGLFKEPRYVNIAFGLSLGMTSDLAFISILPLLLGSYGFDGGQRTTILVVFFTADLVSRILLCVASAVTKVWNRYVFLAGALLSAVFRVAFTVDTSYIWILTVSAILGFLRCFIQTPLPLVVAEQYGPRFPTAFSLYMVVCGVVALTVGVLSCVVKHLTRSNEMVVHLLTVAYLLCAVPWLMEVIIDKVFKRKKETKSNKQNLQSQCVPSTDDLTLNPLLNHSKQ